MYATLDRLCRRVAIAAALLGGAVLVAVIAMSSASILGRAMMPLGLGPIRGDYEMVELGVGFAVFCFLPFTQYARGHARVDILGPLMGNRVNRLVDIASDLLMLAIGLVLFSRLWAGMADKRAYGETTFILQWPVWPAYLVDLLALGVLVLVSGFSIWRSLRGTETAA